MTFPNGCSRVSSQKWNDQPPKRKLPDGSSSGPPGACMTPSRDMNTAPVSLRIRVRAFDRRIQRRDVDLSHRLHRLEGAPVPLAAFAHQIDQAPRRDLPAEAELILAPAAVAFLASVPGDRIPIAVGFFLVVGHDRKADGFVELELWPPIQKHEGHSEDGHLDHERVAFLAGRIVAGRASDMVDPRGGES